MAAGIRDLASPAKSPKRESGRKDHSKKRKRDVDVANDESAESADLDTALKRKKREEEKGKEEKKERKDKKKREKDRSKPNDGGTKDSKHREANKKLKEQLQSMVINDQTEPLATERLHNISNPGVNPKVPPSPLKPILKSPTNRMDISKGSLGNVDTNASKADAQSTPPKSALSKPTKPKKSVKFHSEAAAEDGESRQRIHSALIAAYKASEAAEAAAVTPEELANSLDANAPPAKKQKREKKKEKREKVKKGGKDENAKQGALSYMLEYHKNRDTWKFQKAKQNWILRNAFDINEIEDTKENGVALKAYIAGLQGQEARNRLLEGAKEILKDEGDSRLKNTEGDVSNSEVEKKLARAKLVMIGLGHEDDDDKGDGEDSVKGHISKTNPKGGDGDDDEDDDDNDDDDGASEDSDMTDESDNSED